MTPVTAAEKASHSISAYGTARSTISGTPLSAEELRKTHAYWRACNYLMLGMIYLQDNPLLRQPLKLEHIKNRLLGQDRKSTRLNSSHVAISYAVFCLKKKKKRQKHKSSNM